MEKVIKENTKVKNVEIIWYAYKSKSDSFLITMDLNKFYFDIFLGIFFILKRFLYMIKKWFTIFSDL